MLNLLQSGSLDNDIEVVKPSILPLKYQYECRLDENLHLIDLPHLQLLQQTHYFHTHYKQDNLNYISVFITIITLAETEYSHLEQTTLKDSSILLPQKQYYLPFDSEFASLPTLQQTLVEDFEPQKLHESELVNPVVSPSSLCILELISNHHKSQEYLSFHEYQLQYYHVQEEHEEL